MNANIKQNQYLFDPIYGTYILTSALSPLPACPANDLIMLTVGSFAIIAGLAVTVGTITFLPILFMILFIVIVVLCANINNTYSYLNIFYITSHEYDSCVNTQECRQQHQQQ